MNAKFDPNTYQDNFDALLLQLSQEISNLSRAGIQDSAPHRDLENYIYELNSFYYRSFVERFCPNYKNSVKEEVSYLLQLSRQEDMVKHDIMANLKRYAKLYNQCKRLASLIEHWREENEQVRQPFSGDLDRHKLELYYALKSIYSNLLALQGLIQGLKALFEDQELVNIINNAAIPNDLLDVFSYLNGNNPLVMEHFNCLLIELRKLLNVQTKATIAKEDNYQVLEQTMASALQDLAALADKADKSIQAFYRRNVLEPLLLKAGLLSQYGRSSNWTQYERTAQDYKLYLHNLLYILEKALSLVHAPSRHLLRAASQISSLKPEHFGQLLPKLDELIKEINDLINDFPLAAEADFAYFTGKSLDIIDKSLTWLNALTEQEETATIAPLDLLLSKLEHELSYFQLRLEILTAQQNQSAQVFTRLAQIDQMLFSYLVLITDIRADLERLLAPRNLSRAWKDMQVKVEHLALEKGRYFPSDYLDLLDKYRVETRMTGQHSNIILHEEGDIFIIKVENLREEEVPYLVISQHAPASDTKD
ncbi:MAG: hypothetical protein PHX14_01810 [Syntrophomonadaceae bacterium]|nr:hypothetical protein [Syntrophomonadaceae bacterium]